MKQMPHFYWPQIAFMKLWKKALKALIRDGGELNLIELILFKIKSSADWGGL